MANVVNIEVRRVYRCSDINCDSIIAVTQNCSDPWITLCPFCENETMLLESGKCNLTTVLDLQRGKTIGAVGDKAQQKAIQSGDKVEPKRHKPWWRSKGGKPNFQILKNPQKYISDGSF